MPLHRAKVPADLADRMAPESGRENPSGPRPKRAAEGRREAAQPREITGVGEGIRTPDIQSHSLAL
jgi:hypothetical protein